jgi:hypothetical protein
MQDLLQEKVCVPPNTLPVPIFCKPLLTFDVNNGLHYYLFVIRSYANKVTEQIANGKTPRRIPKQVVQRALMRLI